MSLVYISPEILDFGNVILDWSHLVRETLMDITDDAAIFLYEKFHIILLLARRKIEHHRGLTDDWQSFYKNCVRRLLCAHF